MSLRITLLVVFLASIVGCASQSEPGRRMMGVAASESRMMQAEPAGFTAPSDRYIVRSANVGIAVADPVETSESLRGIVQSYGGHIENTYNNDNERVHLSAKIPEPRLEEFVEQVAGMGELKSKSFSAYDVTEEMIDIDARLQNLVALRDRFRELLTRADKVADLLAIESELARVQAEIDSIQNRREALQNQVAFSRADISIEQKTIYGPLGYVANGVYWVIKKLFVLR